MAGKLTVAVAVLFFLFTFAHSKYSQVDLPENDVANRDTSTDLPESDPQTITTIVLPSERPGSEPATAVEIEPYTETVASKLSDTETLIGAAKSMKEKPESETDSVPLTVISFRPINGHFPQRPLLSLRRGHRCRHHRHQFKPWAARIKGREVSYGNDMILSGGEDSEFQGGVRQIPARWSKFDHDKPKFSFMRDMANREEMKRSRYHHHHRHEEERQHKHEGGLLKKIRKFLTHF